MSLDLTLVKKTEVYSTNITHNLSEMALDLQLYNPLWHPEKCNIKVARDLIEPIERGIANMIADPGRYKKFDADNGWGTYDDFLRFLQELLKACKENPDTYIEVDR